MKENPGVLLKNKDNRPNLSYMPTCMHVIYIYPFKIRRFQERDMDFKKGGEGATCEKLNHLSKEREDL